MNEEIPGRRKICRLFLLALVAGFFGSYPLALIPPGIIRLGFGIVMPTVFLLSLFAIPLLVRCRFSLPKPYVLGFAIFAIAVLLNLIRHQDFEAAVTVLGCILIPLAVAVIASQSDLLSTKRLANFAFFYWLVQVGYCCWGLATSEAVGLTGNRNWMASMLLGLTPGCWLFVRRRLGPGMWTVAVFAIGCGLPTLLLLKADASRSAWLSLVVLAAALPVLLLLRYRVAFAAFYRARSRYNRVMVVLILTLTPITALMLTQVALLKWASPQTVPQRLLETVREDIRVPMYSSTCRLISDHPILGVGPGNFRREFTEYRSESTYHSRLVAARVSIHPHNEALHIAAVLGLPAMLAWLALLLPIVSALVSGNTRQVAAAASAFFLYFQSFLDQTMVQAPGCLLAFVALGLLWSEKLRPLPELHSLHVPHHMHRTAYSLSVLVFLCAAFAIGSRELRRTHLMRTGRIEERLAVHKPNELRTPHYERAHAAYARAAQIAPNVPRAHFFAGLVAVDRLRKPDVALLHFVDVHALDPNYAIVNAKIGKTLGMLSKSAEALPYFARHCQLYPRSPDGFQEYLICLALNAQYADMPLVLDHLRGIYAERAALSHAPEALEKLRRAWRKAVLNRDIDDAIRLANEICLNQDMSFVDPALHFVLPRKRWPIDFLHEGFNALDFIYWERSLAAEALASQLDGDILTQINAFFKSSNSEPDPESKLDLVAVLARKRGLLPLAELNADGRPIGCLLFGKDSCERLDWVANSATPCDANSRADHRGGVVLQPQAFLLKNQVLGSLVGVPDMDVMPTILLSSVAETKIAILELGAVCYAKPFEAVFARLQALESKKKGGQ
jgi:O-antigen ligase/tetratricopeptide (TPR) repeat protein